MTEKNRFYPKTGYDRPHTKSNILKDNFIVKIFNFQNIFASIRLQRYLSENTRDEYLGVGKVNYAG